MNTLTKILAGPAAVVAVVAAALLVAPASAREAPPAGGEPKDFALPDVERLALDNGLKATLIPFGTVPKTTITIVVRAGNLNEGADTWLADLTGEMLKQGTPSRGATDIALEAARMGGGLAISVGPDTTEIGIDVLSEFGPDAIALVADVLTAASLPEDELPRVRRDFQRTLSVALTQPRAQASAEFARLIYGDHPYGRAFPTDAQLAGYTIDDVRDFYRSQYGAARTHVYVAGRFDQAAIAEALNTALGGWKRGAEPVSLPAEPSSRLRVTLVDRPDAPQSTLYLGLPVVDPTSDDFLALQVTNTLLGGFFSSRITANIREDKGYTYSPRSRVASRYRASHWVQVADVTTEATGPALKEIFYEIDRLQADPPGQAELDGVKNYSTGIFVLGAASRGGLIGQFAYLDLHGLPMERLTNYVANVQALDTDRIADIARTYLRDEDMTLVVVGDLARISDQLKELPQLAPVEFVVAGAQ